VQGAEQDPVRALVQRAGAYRLAACRYGPVMIAQRTGRLGDQFQGPQC
jgi:hypothetical protein